MGTLLAELLRCFLKKGKLILFPGFSRKDPSNSAGTVYDYFLWKTAVERGMIWTPKLYNKKDRSPCSFKRK